VSQLSCCCGPAVPGVSIERVSDLLSHDDADA